MDDSWQGEWSLVREVIKTLSLKKENFKHILYTKS